ncbi:MAG: ABC transporter substrate-binding protein, partial [Alphaproteobacteria bacterium]|nr:ABC transporter substrate-binding protein [Alphaproteobacteria bacterium]
MEMNRRHALKGIASTAGILTVVQFASAARAADKVRVALPAAGQVFYAPVYAAQELGFYAKNNVEADIVVYRGGGPVQEALVAGAADIGSLIPFGVAQAVKNGVDQK